MGRLLPGKECGVTNYAFVTNCRDFDRTSVIHHHHGRDNAANWEIDVVDWQSMSVQRLPEIQAYQLAHSVMR